MKDLNLSDIHEWSLGSFFHSNSPLLIVNKHTVIYTWIIIAFVFFVLIILNFFMKKYSTLKKITCYCVEPFINLTIQSIGYFSLSHFCFIGALFSFIFLCNIAPLIPGMDEPTKDLNTTLSLGLLAFLYIQATAIKQNGFWSYIKNEYFSPFFIMLPLHVIGKIASIVSISFRLFGNIFGGSIITNIYFGTLKNSLLFQFLGLFTGLNIIIVSFFTLFEGFLQAFVFTMLTLTYLAIALQDEHE